MLHSFDQTSAQPLELVVAIHPGEPTDEELMERITQKDEAALVMLHRRHHALLRTIISRGLYCDHDVDDLVQECLLELWRHAENYSPEKGRALGWIVTLVRRRTIDRIRRKMAYSRAQDRLRADVAIDGESHSAGADEEVVATDRAEVVASLIARLPEAQQQVVKLAFYRGMSQREIAAHTKLPLGTVKTRLELALRKLRSFVLAFGDLRDPMAAAA